MRLGRKKIIGADIKEIFKEMKTDNYSEAKKKFMKEAKSIAKKRSR
ncbi:hypothetical protein ABET41_12760 [Metabacillus fastidiosus]|uniref:Uncharacterized protein n=1 Tax=Metabacillus fastidiosus TaxID=1458 RepID=A0ABU6NZX8_9BACI|nr:hypothetical protein [Metabacillus fastidiosus]MED4402283.1 hypothetical protein [Metabacillus fastidiosus]MED4454935.1 hypothetical protein [Metabacillus fastidiosus]MED4462154.1 hypothetical protein [Metabacillus fastidiosus]